MLGFCMSCHKLVAIRQGKPVHEGARCDYYPVPHEKCDGDKRAIK